MEQFSLLTNSLVVLKPEILKSFRNRKQRTLCMACGYATGTINNYGLENREKTGGGGSFIRKCFNSEISLKPFNLDWCLLFNIYLDKLFILTLFHLLAWNTFYLAAASFPQTCESVSPWDLLSTSMQHRMKFIFKSSEDRIASYRTPAPATSCSSSDESCGNPRPLNMPSGKRQSPRCRANPRPKSTDLEWAGDRC